MTTETRTGTTESTMQRRGMRTWYRVVGDPHNGQAPLVICHGGPGGTHDYLTAVTELSRSGRACIVYDQFGNGRSGRRPDAPPEFWTVTLFLDELQDLIDHLGIGDGFHVLGQSWGGMLAMELALRHPAGLLSIVVANAPASTAIWMSEAARLMAELPADVHATLERHQAAGTTDSAEYQEATHVYYQRHVCRLDPPPEEVLRTFAALESDPTVYRTMAGSSEFNATGTLKDWDITGQLGDIDVPVLLISGRYDEATPRVVEQIQKGIPGAEWVLFENSSHMPHLEEKERYLDVVEAFLDRVEGEPRRSDAEL